MKINILDCTLRDGGYYNNWDFDSETVKRYLNSMAESGIQFVELGFRFIPSETFRGAFAYTTEKFLNDIDLPKGPVYGVMLNGKDFINYEDGGLYQLNKLFLQEEESKITLVRIAINFDDALKTKKIAMRLKQLGYLVGINLMQANGKSDSDYIELAKHIDSWDTKVDVLYFADSLGNMHPEDVIRINKQLKIGWHGDIGIHTHNNKNLALINSLTAISNGINWCDSTMTGMGRGAGNVTTESLLLEMKKLGHSYGGIKSIHEIVEIFTLLKDDFKWGPNLHYHYAANHNIHPTFVQNLLSNQRYDNKQVINALEFLSDRKTTSFSIETLHQSVYGNINDSSGTWDATSWLKGREVLIVGAGPSVQQYSKGILNYVERFNPAVIFLNINQNLPSSIATATVVSHETRVLFDSNYYENLSHPIIMPKARLGSLLKDKKKGLEILDYGLTLKENNFIINPNGCVLEWSLAAAYAFAVVTQSGAKKISLVGFDGYSADDLRQEEMNEVFNMYLSIKKKLEIVTLTPSTYNIKHTSLFAPEQ